MFRNINATSVNALSHVSQGFMHPELRVLFYSNAFYKAVCDLVEIITTDITELFIHTVRKKIKNRTFFVFLCVILNGCSDLVRQEKCVFAKKKSVGTEAEEENTQSKLAETKTPTFYLHITGGTSRASQIGDKKVHPRERLPFKLLILFNMFSLGFLCLANLLMSPCSAEPCCCLTGKWFSGSSACSQRLPGCCEASRGRCRCRSFLFDQRR